MNFKKFFGKTLKTQISDLTDSILNEKWLNKIPKTDIKNSGIIDSREIIFEFLEYNENGCAYEHLTYVISECNIELNSDQINEMGIIAKKLNIKKGVQNRL